MNYQEALDWLYSTQHFGIKLGLDAPKKLLRQFLANPKAGVKVAHVAGTNGKGSTCAILDAIARASGTRTGLFTSPHLVEFGERIRVNGEMIPQEEVAKGLTELRDLVANWEHHPTFFELTLVLAMRYFKQRDCELIILETGMGGRLDATTAVPADVCAITPIALDHAEWLGNNLATIAGEKAGIILDGVPVISSAQQPEALGVIAEEADAKRAPLTVVDEPLTGYSIRLPGLHQQYNANLALHIADSLGLSLSFDIVQHALNAVHWPGRFESLRNSPPMILDGAHNSHATRALIDTWKQQFGEQKASLIFGAVECKDIKDSLTLLCEIVEHIYLTPIDSPRSLSAEALHEMLPEGSPPASCMPSLEACLEQTTRSTTLIAGSLFLVGQTKALFADLAFQRSTQ